MRRLFPFIIVLFALAFPTGIAYGACNSTDAVDQGVDQGIPVLVVDEDGKPLGCGRLVPRRDAVARQYDPSTGRFASRDPLEHPVGLPYSNTYHYGFNNPLVNTDPSGMCVFGLSCPFGGEPETVTYHDPNPPEPSCDGKPRSDAATVYCANQLQHKLDCLDPVLRPDQQYAEVCGTGVPVEATGDIDAAFAVVGGVRLVWKGGKWVVAKAAGGGGAAVGATATGSRLVDEAFDAVNDFLGSGTKAIPTKNGDLVLLSKDGTRRVRFDINHPKPHKNPHMHVEVRNPDGTWNKSGQIYPRDVPHE